MSDEKFSKYMDKPIGAIMAELDYADQERIVFHYLDGFFVYNILEETFEHKLDLSLLNCAPHQQGDTGIIINVSQDGKKAFIKNMGPEDLIADLDNYIIDLKSGKAKVTKEPDPGKVFAGFSNTDTLTSVAGWHSRKAAVVNEKLYFISVSEIPYVNGLKFIICDKSGNVEKSTYIFPRKSYEYKGENITVTLPTANVAESTFDDIAPILSSGAIVIDDLVWFKPDELSAKEGTMTHGSLVEPIYGYNLEIFKVTKALNGEDTVKYFIKHPKAGGNHSVIMMGMGRFAEDELDAMLESIKFNTSPLYEKTKAYLSDEFDRVFSPYYDIVDLQMTNWQESEGTATFHYKMVHQTINRDVESVDYLNKIKVNNPESYSLAIADYLSKKEGNFEFKVVQEDDNLKLYSNISPTGTVWEETKIDDYILR